MVYPYAAGRVGFQWFGPAPTANASGTVRAVRVPELQGGALYPELGVLSQRVHTRCQLKASSTAKARDSLHAMTMLCALVSCKRMLGARFVAWMRSIGELIRTSSEKSVELPEVALQERLSGQLLELHDVCLPTRVVGVGQSTAFPPA